MEKNQIDKNIIQFKTFDLWLRITAILFSITILTVNALAIKNGTHSILLIILGILFLISSLYEHSYIFNLDDKKIIQKTGLIFFFKKRNINFSAINNIDIETFKLPGRIGSYTEIIIYLKDGEKVMIEKEKTKKIKSQIEELKLVQEIIYKQNR